MRRFALLALFVLPSLLVVAAATIRGQTPQRGVGYVPVNAVSFAGQGKPGCPANGSRMDLTVDPWASGTFDRSKMAGRYGSCWEAGAPGPHQSDYAGYLREDFAGRVARWNPDYSRWDGNPTEREVNDAYYSMDCRVRRGCGSARPTPIPSPTATPVVAPTGAPTPSLPPPQLSPSPSSTPATCAACDQYDELPAKPPGCQAVERLAEKRPGALLTWGVDRAANVAECAAWLKVVEGAVYRRRE